ncbi:DUF3021 family protein [Fusibacter bizertensis]|uniref:DUF3021 family protein n=1 Tax=Fusibacter bizertensis TaxID=1488331 RepID=A0ABT6NHP9_9FIRM|nr:DUF3021 family protein [Fusibacter bizertensis]MDH8679858.1 DUF3021 family protein [Fusibacter bizertensis]
MKMIEIIKIEKGTFRKSVFGIFISFFLLHVMLILASLSNGELSLIIANNLGWSELRTYIFQVFITIWTGAMIPISLAYLDDDTPMYHARVFINFILTFSIYVLWITFVFGAPKSLVGYVILFVLYALCDYWLIYGLSYIGLNKKVKQLNRKIDNIENMENTFLRGGDSFDSYKRYS